MAGFNEFRDPQAPELFRVIRKPVFVLTITRYVTYSHMCRDGGTFLLTAGMRRRRIAGVV